MGPSALAEVLYVSAPGVSSAATGPKIYIPTVESLTIVEFGLYNDGGANVGAGAVLTLQVVDSAAQATSSTLTATTTAAAVQGTKTFRRSELSVDKLNNVFVVPQGTPTAPAAGRSWTAIVLNLTTAGAASSTCVFFMKVRKSGTNAAAAAFGETIVTV